MSWTPPPPPDGPADPPLRLVTESLKGLQARPVKYLVRGKIPLGKLSCVAGVGGMGKSTLIRHLAARLTTGRPAFGLEYDPPPACDVLLASVEDAPEDTLVPHLAAEGADLARVRRIKGSAKPDGKLLQFDLRDVDQLVGELREHPEVRLIVIDPILSFVGRAGVNENSSSEVRTVIDPLIDLARDANVAVLLVANLNKATNVAAVHRIIGASAFRDGCRAVFAVGTDPQEPDRRVMALVKENLPGLDRRSVTFARVPLTADDVARVMAEDEFARLDAADRADLAEQLYVLTGFRAGTVDADEALGTGRREGEGASPRRPCAAWLQERLGTTYAWLDAEVEEEAVEAGYSVSQYRRAKNHLKPRLQCAPPAAGHAWILGLGPVRNMIVRTRTQAAGGVQSAQSDHSCADRNDEIPRETRQCAQSDQSAHQTPAAQTGGGEQPDLWPHRPGGSNGV